jgi:autoinducer 2 (AI-2) kinase
LRHGERILAEYGEKMYVSSGHWPVPNWIAGGILPLLREEYQEKFSSIRSLLMISDWVNWILTGEYCSDGSSACETSLFSIVDNNWDWGLIEDLGLPLSIFPEIKLNSDRVGVITDEVASVANLPKGTPVFLGGADTQCGLLGMGVGLGEVGAVGGTTTPVQLTLATPMVDPEKRTWSNNHVVPGQWILESNCGYTGREVRWVRDNLGFEGYEQLNSIAANVPPGSNGILTYRGAHLFNAGPPYWEDDKLGDAPIKQGVYGRDDPSPSELARSIIESNSYAVKANLAQLEEIYGTKASILTFCGGNSRSSLWMQIQAVVLGLPVIVPKVNDGTAVGSAILAAVGSGYYSSIDEAVSEMVKQNSPVMPDPVRVKSYEPLYREWMDTRIRLSQG